nr:Mobile element protein [Escherichia coli O25b:H4-ST131]
MDETYVKVNGRWAYLFRPSTAGDCRFYLSSRRNSKAAYQFLGKILNNVKKWQIRDSSTRIKRPPMVALALQTRRPVPV